MSYHDRNCIACGRLITGGRADKRYCSTRCRVAWFRFKNKQVLGNDGKPWGVKLITLRENPPSPSRRNREIHRRVSRIAKLLAVQRDFFNVLDNVPMGELNND